jgi:hypothetical protein
MSVSQRSPIFPFGIAGKLFGINLPGLAQLPRSSASSGTRKVGVRRGERSTTDPVARNRGHRAGALSGGGGADAVGAARLLASNQASDGDSQSPHSPTIVGDAGGKVLPPGTAAA